MISAVCRGLAGTQLIPQVQSHKQLTPHDTQWIQLKQLTSERIPRRWLLQLFQLLLQGFQQFVEALQGVPPSPEPQTVETSGETADP